MNKILVTQSSMPSYEEYIEEIKSIWETKWLTNSGEKHQLLERKLSEYLEVNNTILFCNGHLALLTALKNLNLSGEVITTPFTFASTTHAIVEAGLTPVFCDIDKDTYTIDVNKIEELITDKTTAIVGVHVYGVPCDVNAIECIAKKHNLKVIYDSAHAFGVSVNGKTISNYGDVSMFSFHATKVFNTIEGGALVFNDNKLADKFNKYKNFGLDAEANCPLIGTNAKMNEFSASMGLCNLRHVDDEIEKRKAVYNRYISHLKDVSGIQLICYNENVIPNYAYFPIVVDKLLFGKNRDEIMLSLEEKGIFSRKYFYPLTSEFYCYKDLKINDTPIAKNISENVLCLPMYAELSMDEVDKICDIVLRK